MSRRIRVLASIFLAAFFVGSMLSGHHHLNPIGDLVSEGKSDSGTFLRSLGGLHPRGEWLSSGALVRDHPCPACFWDDARTLAAYSLSFAVTVAVLPFRPGPCARVSGAPPPPRSFDRGPPRGR